MEYIEGLLSICCTCYNHEKYIEDCIKSIWNNDYKNVEIIVVDDGSTDNSVEILKALQAKSPCRFELIVQKNTHNIPLNCNRAIAKARGEYITFFSTDDYYTNDAFSKKLDIMNNDPNLAFVVSRYMYYKEFDNEPIMGDHVGTTFNNNTTIDQMLELEYQRDNFSIQGNIFRKEIIDNIGGFDEDMDGDDIVLRTKMLQYMGKNRKWGFKLIDAPACVYRVHSNNIHYNKALMISIVLGTYDRYWAEKPYPEYVKNGIITDICNSDFKKTTKVLFKHPRFMQLIFEDDFFREIILYKLSEITDKKSFWLKKILNATFVNDIITIRYTYIIFNIIKIKFKRKRSVK